MTLVVIVVSNHGLWQSTDHRLSSREGEVLPDPSVKNIYLEAEDGKAMIAYAGIGKVKDMQISEWVRGVLRGKRRNLVDHMAVLCAAANRKLIPISKAADTSHTFSIVAYENGEATLHIMTNRILHDDKHIVGEKFYWERRLLKDTHSGLGINVEGQGALSLAPSEVREMVTQAIRHRTGKPSLGKDVAAALARLNAKASNDRRSEGQVSKSCMVTYLASPMDGLAHWFYGWDSEDKKPILQDVSGEFDVTNIVEIIAPISFDYLARKLEALKKGEPFDEQMDVDDLNKRLRRNYKKPSDEFE